MTANDFPPALPRRQVSLRVAWYALVLLASLLPAFAIAPWLADKARALLLEQALLREELFHEQTATYLHLEAERLTSVLQNKADAMALALRLPARAAPVTDILQRILDREPAISCARLLDPQARAIAARHRQGHSMPAIGPHAPAFVIPMHGRVHLGSPRRMRDGHYEFILAVPVMGAHGPRGVLVATIDIHAFWRGIGRTLPAHHAHAYLIDGRGALLVQQHGAQRLQGRLLSELPIVRRLLAHQDWHELKPYRDLAGTRVLGIGTHVRLLQWGLISEVPWSQVMAPIKPVLAMLFIIVVAIHLLFGLLALWLGRRMMQPLALFVQRMRRAADGDYAQHITPSAYREINELGRTFTRMLRQIERRERALGRLSQAIEQLGEAIIITDPEGNIEYVNPAFCRMTGYRADEVRGKTPAILHSEMQPPAFYDRLWQTIRAGKIWEGRLVNRRKDGSLYPVIMSIAPIFEQDTITHFVAVQQDISMQEQLEGQLIQVQKMEAIGTLVGGIAHDFNNMLAGITGNLYLAKRDLPEHAPARQKLEQIEQLAGRAANMIQQLLTFARKSPVHMRPLAVTSLIREIGQFLKPTIPENIHFTLRLCAEELHIQGDETLLHQMIMNLIANARDAVADCPQPRIELSLAPVELDAQAAAEIPEGYAGRFARISVCDNGEGIDEQAMSRLFEPFFTTKPTGKGTGLGLAMVFGAVRTHHGFIDVHSAPGEGATFHIYLPLSQVEETPNEAKEATTDNPAPGKQECILLVDDEPFVRETIAEVLESLGYCVLAAENGREAASLFTQHAERIRLLISDVVMPEGSGPELVRRIRDCAPDLPVIFITGYDREEVLRERMEHCAVIGKPIRFDQLATTIRRMLAG